MAIAKKVLISYIVGGVGVVGGVTGLVIGLTKKPEEIIVPIPEPTPISGYTLTLHYGDKIKELPCQTTESLTEAPQIPSTWLEPHYVSQGWYSDSTCTSPITFPYNIQDDTDFYLKAGIGMGKVYLHTDTNPKGTTYNGTDDWYHTEEYKNLGPGFAKRDEPAVDNYKKLGWARVDTDMDNPDEWPEPTTDDVLKDNEWPVYPKANKIAHLYPMYELEYTTFTFRNNEGKELLSPLRTECKEQTEARDFRAPSSEDIKHYTFGGWKYAHDYDVVIGGQTDTRKAGTIVSEADKKAGFTSPTVELIADLTQYQYGATFWLDDTGSKTDTVWADIEGGKATITAEMVAKLSKPKSSDSTKDFAYWYDANDTKTIPTPIEWPQEISNDDKVYKPYFETATTTVTIDFDEGIWKHPTLSDITPTGVSFNVFPNKTYTSTELTNKAREACEITDEEYYLSGSNPNLPNFYGWYINGAVQDTYKFGDTDTTITATYNNVDDIIVTFNTNGGYFTYINEYGDATPVTSLVKEINIPEWRDNHDGTIVIKDIYDELLEDYSIEDYPAKLARDGFKLNEGEIYGEGYGSYSGWLNAGNNLPNDCEITKSVSLSADWNKKEATGNWWTDDWYTIAELSDEPAKNPSEAPVTGTRLEEVYSKAFKETDADGEAGDETKAENTFVGLQKEIDLPQLGYDTFTTRVIGQAQDTIYGETNKALLTFDFVDCPVVGAFGFKNDYKDDMASFNNSTAKSSVRSAMPEGLRSMLKTVTKYSMDTGYIDQDTTVDPFSEEFKTDLFLLSATEVNGETDYSSKIENDRGGSNFFTYEYYEKTPTGTTRTKSDMGSNDTTNNYRIKYYDNQITSWWTRTPARSGYGWRETGASSSITANAWYVTITEHSPTVDKPYRGGVWMYGCVEARGLAPAFCIGTYLGD